MKGLVAYALELAPTLRVGTVIPAYAGIQVLGPLDLRLRGESRVIGGDNTSGNFGGDAYRDFTFTGTAVPEPGTALRTTTATLAETCTRRRRI